MRRKERQVLDERAIGQILQDSAYCHLALSAEEKPYTVPLNFGYIWDDGMLTLYFHCAHEGEKLDILRANARAAVSMVAEAEVYSKDAELACKYSSSFRSLAASGRVEVIKDAEEKIRGLELLMAHYAPEKRFEIGKREAGQTTVLRFVAEGVTAKESPRWQSA